MRGSFFEWVWLVPLLPLTSAAVMLLVGRHLRRAVISWLCCGTVGLSFLLSLAIFRQLSAVPAAARVYEKTLFTWLPLGLLQAGGGLADLRVEWGYLIDPLSAVMILVVSGVGFLIHVYSVGYMAHEGGYYRYFGYLNLFMFMMLTLVLANNFLVLFVGWEGVGLCSYLLIGFWFLKKTAADAGKKAFIVNRVGDAGFLVGIFLIATTFGTVNFTRINATLAGGSFSVGDAVITAITLLLFMGATGKSAQIPLYVWLPDAMEGPTPVSALIHAATMVTAGVYMVSRANALYQLAPTTLEVVALVGGLTAVYAASMGLVQNDIKRVLAYSTISQLGYMFLACGMGAFAAGIFHLSTHAYFKALLFLAAGSVMHALSNETDIRKMGGLWNRIPVTARTFVIGGVAIAGIFPLAGFFSKDEILWKTFSNPAYPVGPRSLLWGVGVVTAVMTAFYIFRLVFLTFFGKSRVPHEVEHHIHESPRIMTIPLVLLALLSIVGGWVGWPAAVGGENRFEHFLAPVFTSGVALHTAEAAEHSYGLERVLMVVSLVAGFLGIWIAYQFYLKHPELAEQMAFRFPRLYKTLFNKYYVDELYSTVFVEGPVLGKAMGTSLARFDLKVIDGIGVDGTGWFARFTSRLSIWWDTWIVDGAVRALGFTIWVLSWPVRIVQTGFVQGYLLLMATGVVAFLLYYVARYLR
ncbi:MAG: NADH-quinone oxidoreductase subunit L [Acidobacteria bacterium]|nr:NADH-quinone oxidoreductase subunit L [Acidobacteriota bacterium]